MWDIFILISYFKHNGMSCAKIVNCILDFSLYPTNKAVYFHYTEKSLECTEVFIGYVLVIGLY